ncbi:unnamed protein product, partial [marine sediment metagenome]
MDPNDRVFIIAEVGQAHDGSLGTAHRYIEAIATTGADAVKFQVHMDTSPDEEWRIKFSLQDETRYDYWHRTCFAEDEWRGLAKHARSEGLRFGASAFSMAALLMLKRVGVDYWKVPSGKLTDLDMLKWLSLQPEPIFLSTGMATWDEIGRAADQFPTAIFLQCTTKYPTAARD